MSLVAADIGSDDVINGGHVLEMAQGGFSREGFWLMMINGKTLEIPLIGPHSSNTEVKRVQYKKKIRKIAARI